MKSTRRCHIRKVSGADYSKLEEIYLAHEGVSIPEGHFAEFSKTIRDDSISYFVAEVDGQVVGGGGIINYIPSIQVMLTFGVVDPASCNRGYGTDLLLARLVAIDAKCDGCEILVQATEQSANFFQKIGFTWYGADEDERGNRFLHGRNTIYPATQKMFRRILESRLVTLAPEISCHDAPK